MQWMIDRMKKILSGEDGGFYGRPTYSSLVEGLERLVKEAEFLGAGDVGSGFSMHPAELASQLNAAIDKWDQRFEGMLERISVVELQTHELKDWIEDGVSLAIGFTRSVMDCHIPNNRSYDKSIADEHLAWLYRLDSLFDEDEDDEDEEEDVGGEVQSKVESGTSHAPETGSHGPADVERDIVMRMADGSIISRFTEDEAVREPNRNWEPVFPDGLSLSERFDVPESPWEWPTVKWKLTTEAWCGAGSHELPNGVHLGDLVSISRDVKPISQELINSLTEDWI